MLAADRTFRIQSSQPGVLEVSGTLSFGNAGEALRAAPFERGAGDVDVDLGALVEADSVTLAVLIAWAAQARARGTNVHYRHAPPALCRLAHLADVDALLELTN